MERREETYSATEAARILGVTNGRIRQLLTGGELEGTKDENGYWLIPQRAVHARLEESPRRTRPDAPGEPESASELQARVEHLQYRLGRLEGQRELESVARSTVEDSLRRERDRADDLQAKADELQRRLDEEQRRGFWSRLFGS